MATDRSETTLADSAGGPEREDPKPPGIAHLTVVPENAER